MNWDKHNKYNKYRFRIRNPPPSYEGVGLTDHLGWDYWIVPVKDSARVYARATFSEDGAWKPWPHTELQSLGNFLAVWAGSGGSSARELITVFSDEEEKKENSSSLQYDFTFFEDAPHFPNGVGLTNDLWGWDYWVVPAFADKPTRTRVYVRVRDLWTPRVSPWEPYDNEELRGLGDFLAAWANGNPVARGLATAFERGQLREIVKKISDGDVSSYLDPCSLLLALPYVRAEKRVWVQKEILRYIYGR